MAVTFHLGDCMNACNKCMDNYHSQFNDVCPTCYTELTSKVNSKKTAWDTYKLALATGEINADTFALLTADLPRGE